MKSGDGDMVPVVVLVQGVIGGKIHTDEIVMNRAGIGVAQLRGIDDLVVLTKHVAQGAVVNYLFGIYAQQAGGVLWVANGRSVQESI